jgi:hypothetical protein
MHAKWAFAALSLLAAPFTASSQPKLPPETLNAALRYWQAFAEMKDPLADSDTQLEMSKLLAGEQSWDEAKLGKILDPNQVALGIMLRATKLPECDWGIEYSQHTTASVAMVARGNVLGRLSMLQALREMNRGQSQAAVDRWIAGARFAQDLNKGGSLLFVLTAKNLLVQEMRLITWNAKQRRLNSSQKHSLAAIISALPEDGFDWSAAWQLDWAASDMLFKQLQNSHEPAEIYKAVMGTAALRRCIPPNDGQLKAYRAYMSDVGEALRLPPDAAKQRLLELEATKQNVCESLRLAIPGTQTLNNNRADVVTARKELLDVLTQ